MLPTESEAEFYGLVRRSRSDLCSSCGTRPKAVDDCGVEFLMCEECRVTVGCVQELRLFVVESTQGPRR